MSQRLFIAGASRGIGLEMLKQAVKRGDHVTGTARSDEGLAAIIAAGGEALRADVTDERELAVVAGAIGQPIDILVCNAGLYRGRGGLDADDLGADAWSEVLMTNVAGPFLIIRALLDRMAAPGGRIAIISSKMGSSSGAPGGSYLYRASKAAATNLAVNLSAELKPRGIAVGAYHPGWVRTDMGGSSADIGASESVAGLLARLDALSLDTTGVFEDYAGEQIPF